MKLLNLKLTDAALGYRESQRVEAAIGPSMFNLGQGSEETGFKRITSNASLRDLNPLMQEKMQQVCFYLATTTPFGKRIVEIITTYTVAEGFKTVAPDETVQEVLDKFWDDEVNDIDRSLGEWRDELTKFGELCITVAVNPVNGHVRLGYIDPMEIDSVEFGALRTGDGQTEIAIPVAVRLRRKIHESEGKRLEIIRRDEDPNSPTFGQLKGDCFYRAINKAKSASRGISELFALADWIDVFDQMIFDFADKARFLNQFIWHLILEGGNEQAVKDKQKEMRKSPPRQGQVLTTNEKVKLEAITPDLKGADMSAGAQMVKNYGLGGAGLPGYFFADPMDTNRSTGEVMEGPTGKKLTKAQDEMRTLIWRILEFVLDQAIAHGTLAEKVDRSFDVQVPDLSIKDLKKGVDTLQTGGNALSLGEERGWIRGETAARGFHLLLTQLGLEIESKDEFEKAQEELGAREAEAINRIKPAKELEDELKNAAAETLH